MQVLSNKKKGSNFEEELASILARHGFWAHVVAPNPKDGSQPFDVIAAKNNRVYNFDCKTLDVAKFPLRRIEENQEKAFTKLMDCGCDRNFFAFKRADGTIWLTDAWYCIAEKRAGVKSVDPGVCDIETWCKLCESR